MPFEAQPDPIVFGQAVADVVAQAHAADLFISRSDAGKTVSFRDITQPDPDPWPTPTGWRAAPACASCDDRGRVATRVIPEREITAELLHQMANVFQQSYDADPLREHDGRVRAGLGAVLEKVLKPCETDAHCSCKAGRRASELWYADKHGQYHPDAPDPEPDHDDYR